MNFHENWIMQGLECKERTGNSKGNIYLPEALGEIKGPYLLTFKKLLGVSYVICKTLFLMLVNQRNFITLKEY